MADNRRKYSIITCVSYCSGGGLLVELMKQAVKSKDLTQLDKAIVEMVEPCLYNKGAGRMIHIAHLVLLRNRDRPKHKLVGIKDCQQLNHSSLF